MAILGLFMAALIGISLGLLGGGGSILAVPILVYVVGMGAKPAIATSLLVVGATSFVGSLRHLRAANVDVRTALVFGVVSMACSYGGGRLASFLSDTFQLGFFSVVMIAASLGMFRSRNEEGRGSVHPGLVAVSAAGVGLLTGIVGVGGGFLIVPALVLLAGIPMKRAVGTSLVVIAMNSAAAYIAYSKHVSLDWRYTAMFTGFALAGVLAGSALVESVSQKVLRRAFATFIAGVGSFILIEILTRNVFN
ncbi:MAG TPA: sulfite exporter TauE/SafE family protein [Thermoanaerobaculia bacterium]|nr:sulfite exporter TauE/SafE family protein [Thermoanaerobaculia bacterium]